MQANSKMLPLLLRRDDVCRLIGLSRPSLVRLVAKKEFPAPVEIGARSVAWHRQAVEQWVATRPVSTLLPPPARKAA